MAPPAQEAKKDVCLLMPVSDSRHVLKDCLQGRISDSLVLRAGMHHKVYPELPPVHCEDSAALLSC